MVEVIHAYHKNYPFGHKKESQNTFVQQSKLNLRQIDLAVLRHKAKIYQEMDNLFFIRLIKVLKQDNNLYFVYEYQETSLQKFLGNLKKSVGFSLTREIYKSFLNDFTTNINEIINSLIHSQIKALLLLDNVACSAKNNKSYNFSLKAFIDTQAEYLSISKHNYEPKEPKHKDQKGRNQQFLVQFYEAQRKRLEIQFEQLCEKIFGKINETVERKQMPNFIINGTKLIFINKDQKQQEQHELKNNSNNKDDSKQKQIEKQQIQNLTKKLENLNPLEHLQQNQGENFQSSKKKKIQGPIIDFDQSFEPEFKPQQFTKQKTFIYEQTDYLDSLEQQLKKIAAEKKQQQIKKSQLHFQDYNMLKLNQNKKQTMEQLLQNRPKKFQEQFKNDQKQKNNHFGIDTKMIPTTHSNNSNQPYNNQHADKKTEKINKYKMKIITSHEIQIEGGAEQANIQEIEKEIVNNIKTGKLNIKDLGNIQKNSSHSKNQSEENNLSGNSLNGCNNSKEDETNKTKINHEYQRFNLHQKEKIQKGQSQNKQTLKFKEPPPNKIKNINQIIQKMGMNSYNHTESVQKYQKNQQHLDTRFQNKVGFQVRSHRNQNLESSKKQSSEATEKLEKNDGAENEMKAQKSYNYINKIKCAKNKAQQLLREYTKKKQ